MQNKKIKTVFYFQWYFFEKGIHPLSILTNLMNNNKYKKILNFGAIFGHKLTITIIRFI